MEKKKLVLKDSEWDRGQTNSSLVVTRDFDPETLNPIMPVQKFCCLGIWCRDACNISIDQLGYVFPSYLGYEAIGQRYYEILKEKIKVPSYLPDFKGSDNTFSREAVIGLINDNKKISDTQRVEMLRPYFEELGIELEFKVDE